MSGGWLRLQVTEEKVKGNKWGNHTVVGTIKKFDANFKLLQEVELPASAGKVSNFYSELQQLGNKFYFIYVQAQAGAELGDIKSIEVNPATLEFGEPKVLVSSNDLSLTIPDYRYAMFFDIIFKASPSEKFSMMLVKFRNTFIMSSLDENMNPRWTKKESNKDIPATTIHSAEVDNAGNIYIGYDEKYKASYRRYSSTGTSIDKSVVLSEGPATAILFLATPDAVHVAGTYRKGDLCNGVYKGVIDTKGDLTSMSTTEIPKGFLEVLDNEGWASTKSRLYGMNPEYLGELKQWSDGSLVMLAEFCKASGPVAGHETTHVGSVVHVCFGKPEVTFSRAPKRTVGGVLIGYEDHTINSRGKYYYAHPTNSETIIIYGDSPENLSQSIESPTKVNNPNKEILVAARIDKNGNVTREKITPLLISGFMTFDPETISFPVYIEGVEQLVVLKK